VTNNYFIHSDKAKLLCTAILKGVGVDEKDAAIVADNLVTAELRGIGSHGLSRMLVYCERIVNGFINTKPNVKILKEDGSSLLIDGDNGVGQVIGLKAMDMCIQKASKTNISMCTVKNGCHFGIAAYYAMRALEQDMIGIALTNAPSTMCPWGSITPMLGTNPFCFAIPAGSHRPIVLDCATSVVARGKVVLADKENKPIPEGWALDKMGRITTDASEALKGSVLPFGNYKGSGISLIIDILCSMLSGANFGQHIGELYNNSETYQNLGFFFAAINIRNFTDPVLFKQRIDNMIDEIKQSEKASDIEEIYVPGEIEFNNEEINRISGIKVGAGVFNDLVSLVNKYSPQINPYELVISR